MKISIIISVLLLSSCSILPLERSKIIEGNNCYVICDADYSETVYKNVLYVAEEAFLQVRELTDIDINTRIPIYFYDENYNDDLGFTLESGIYISKKIIYAGQQILLDSLRHELVHLFFSMYYGSTTSFIFSEGVAEYYGYQKYRPSGQSELSNNLEDWINFSYMDYGLNRDGFSDVSHQIYDLSHQFIYFWSQTYGEESIKELYPEISSENIVRKLEEFSNRSFEEINLEFTGAYQ